MTFQSTLVLRLPFLFCLLAAVYSCTLEKEPEIPAGANNEKRPVFLPNEIKAVSSTQVLAIARLQDRGQLKAQFYGWVWSEDPNPTIANSSIYPFDGPLNADSFAVEIKPLEQGKTYYFRPYIQTVSGPTYGPESQIYMGLPELNEIAVVADSACFFRLRVALENPGALSDYGVVFKFGSGVEPTLENNDIYIVGFGWINGLNFLDIGDLTPSTTYTMRAYAANEYGVGYSPTLTYTTASAPALSADFSFDTDAEVFKGAIINWQNLSSGANAFSWDFGDGGASTSTHPTHVFGQTGDWHVQLSARTDGCKVIKDTLIRVVENPFENYWVDIPGGTFNMGCTAEQGANCDSDEIPPHIVIVSPFVIGKTEVTQAQWQAVMNENPSKDYQCGGNCPVERVSWDRIMNEFVPALRRKTGVTYTLPTEAQWEFAARGGQTEANFTVYAGSDNLNEVGWNYSNSNLLQAVAGKNPNGYGLFDMSGNVLEYCRDWYNSTYYLSLPAFTQDPTGPPGGDWRVVRSGSYTNPATACRVTMRDLWFTNQGSENLGFRLSRQP